jgi:hypothetical protein
MSEQFKTVLRGIEVEVIMTLHSPTEVEIVVIGPWERCPSAPFDTPLTREELAGLCRQAEQCVQRKSQRALH